MTAPDSESQRSKSQIGTSNHNEDLSVVKGGADLSASTTLRSKFDSARHDTGRLLATNALSGVKHHMMDSSSAYAANSRGKSTP